MCTGITDDCVWHPPTYHNLYLQQECLCLHLISTCQSINRGLIWERANNSIDIFARQQQRLAEKRITNWKLNIYTVCFTPRKTPASKNGGVGGGEWGGRAWGGRACGELLSRQVSPWCCYHYCCWPNCWRRLARLWQPGHLCSRAEGSDGVQKIWLGCTRIHHLLLALTLALVVVSNTVHIS